MRGLSFRVRKGLPCIFNIIHSFLSTNIHSASTMWHRIKWLLKHIDRKVWFLPFRALKSTPRQSSTQPKYSSGPAHTSRVKQDALGNPSLWSNCIKKGWESLLPIDPLVLPPIHSSTHPSTCPSIYLLIRPSLICLPIQLFTRLPFYLSSYLPPICLPTIHPSFRACGKRSIIA